MEFFIRDIEEDTPYKPITKEDLERDLEWLDGYNNGKRWYDMYAVRLEKIEGGAMYFGVAPNEM